MNSRRITPAQTKQLRTLVAHRLRFFSRLVDRMNRVGFIPDDELMNAAITARDAVHALHVKVHYAACDGGG